MGNYVWTYREKGEQLLHHARTWLIKLTARVVNSIQQTFSKITATFSQHSGFWYKVKRQCKRLRLAVNISLVSQVYLSATPYPPFCVHLQAQLQCLQIFSKRYTLENSGWQRSMWGVARPVPERTLRQGCIELLESGVCSWRWAVETSSPSCVVVGRFSVGEDYHYQVQHRHQLWCCFRWL